MQGSRHSDRGVSVRVGVTLTSCNIESTDSVASALTREADLLGLRRRPCWSIAELRLGDAGYEILLEWLAALDPERARRDRETAAQGLVLLALASEAARRLVGTGEVWPALAGLEMPEETRGVLFARGASPRPEVRESISKAASRFGLRSATRAGQRWYATIVLQFGFSLTGLTTQIARWATQGLPDSLEPLRFGSQRSEEFEETWLAIRELGDPARADEARVRLERSCWVLPPWVDALSIAAREVVARPSSVAAPVFSAFDGMRVTWSATRPRLSLHLRRLASDEATRLELDQGRYDVVVDGEVFTCLIRSRGELVPVESTVDDLPPTSSIGVALVTRDGRVDHVEDCVVWDESSPAEAFDRDGRRIVPPGTRRIETIVYEREARLEPAEASVVTGPFGPRDASALRAADVTLHWRDGRTWSPTRIARTSTAPLVLHPETPAVLGEELRLRAPLPVAEVLSPAGWRVEDGAVVGPLAFDTMPTLRGRVRSVDGRAHSFEVALPLRGATMRRRGEWCAVPGEVEARDVTELAWRIFTVDAPRGDVQIFAGARPIARWRSLGVARRIRERPPGRGEPLGWMDAADVMRTDEEPTWIARSIVDHGALDGGRWEDGRLRLQWRAACEPEGSTLIAWTSAGLELVPAEHVAVDGRDWLVPLPSEPIAITVSFRGARLGSWWTRGWSQALARVETSELVERVALFARVACLPILGPEAQGACRAWGPRWPIELTRVWWLDEVFPSSRDELVDAMSAMSVEATSRIEEWRATQRELFLETAFDSDSSESIISVLGARDENDIWMPTALSRAASLGLPWAHPFFEGQCEWLERRHATRRPGQESLLELSRLELLGANASDPPRTVAQLERDLARDLTLKLPRVRELVHDQTAPVPFAKRVALASRDFALVSALHALRL